MGEYQIRRQGFLEAGCDCTRSAPFALHFVPRCLQSAALSRRPKLRFGLEKLINSTLSQKQDLFVTSAGFVQIYCECDSRI